MQEKRRLSEIRKYMKYKNLENISGRKDWVGRHAMRDDEKTKDIVMFGATLVRNIAFHRRGERDF